MMGSTHVYDVPTAIPVGPLGGTKRPDGGTVELTLDPSELDLVDTEAMAARYEQQIRQQQSQLQKEDLSDVVAEHISRQKVIFLVSPINSARLFRLFDDYFSCLFFRQNERNHSNPKNQQKNTKNSNSKSFWVYHSFLKI